MAVNTGLHNSAGCVVCENSQVTLVLDRGRSTLQRIRVVTVNVLKILSASEAPYKAVLTVERYSYSGTFGKFQPLTGEDRGDSESVEVEWTG